VVLHGSSKHIGDGSRCRDAVLPGKERGNLRQQSLLGAFQKERGKEGKGDVYMHSTPSPSRGKRRKRGVNGSYMEERGGNERLRAMICFVDRCSKGQIIPFSEGRGGEERGRACILIARYSIKRRTKKKGGGCKLLQP